MDALLDELLSLERSALDRWIQLDPEGYLEISAPDITYFDPTTDSRVDGIEALRLRLAPIKEMTLPFTNPRYEILEPKVQRYGDVALLTFNVVNYGHLSGGPELVLARWNATQVYGRTKHDWRIVHSHWSYLRPELKQSGF